MSERRTVLSRPRTRVYDCNYNIGERHYKSMIDQLDQKYGNKPAAPSPTSDRLREDEDLRGKSRSALEEFESLLEDRRSKMNGVGDRASSSRGSITNYEDEFDNEVAASLKRIKSAKSRFSKEASLEKEFESTFNSRLNGSKLKLSEKLLDSVGINGKMQEALEDDIFFKKRTLSANTFDEEPTLTKWTALKAGSRDLETSDSADSVAARLRAKQSRARLNDIESEMEELAERGAAREKRTQHLRALLAENELFSEESLKVNKKFTNKKVNF